MSQRRTGALTAIGLVNLILGVCLIAVASFGIFISEQIAVHSAEIAVLEGGTEAIGANGTRQTRTESAASMLRLTAMFALIGGPVMIASGIGILRLALWGRVLGVLVAWIGVAWVPLSAVEVWLRSGEIHISFFALLYWVLALTVLHSAQARALFVERRRARRVDENSSGLPSSVATV